MGAPAAASSVLPEDWSIRPSTVVASDAVAVSSALDGSELSVALGALTSETVDVLAVLATAFAAEVAATAVVDDGPEFLLVVVSELSLAPLFADVRGAAGDAPDCRRRSS